MKKLLYACLFIGSPLAHANPAVCTTQPAAVAANCGTTAKMCEGNTFLGCQLSGAIDPAIVNKYIGMIYSSVGGYKTTGTAYMRSRINLTTKETTFFITKIKRNYSFVNTCLNGPTIFTGRIYKLARGMYSLWDYIPGSTTIVDDKKFGVMNISLDGSYASYNLMSGTLQSNISNSFEVIPMIKSNTYINTNFDFLRSQFICE